MKKKWIMIIGISVLVVFIGVGTLWNYLGFKENQIQTDSDPQITYTGDPQKPQAGEFRKEQEAKLELTQDTVMIEIGSVFQPIDFIKVAEDTHGYSVKERVEINRDIPTDKEGKYEVEYVLDAGNGKTITKKMIVEVCDMNKKREER